MQEKVIVVGGGQSDAALHGDGAGGGNRRGACGEKRVFVQETGCHDIAGNIEKHRCIPPVKKVAIIITTGSPVVMIL